MKAKNYAKFFETINQNTPIKDFENFFEENAKFKDPFHEINGIKNIYNIFQNMYKNLDKPRFKIIEIIEEKNIAYIRWKFYFNLKKDSKENSFIGISRVEFNEDSKVIFHEDFWDAAENIYEKLPIISYIIKYIKNKIRS